MSTIFRTVRASAVQDFYFALRPFVVPLRDLLKIPARPPRPAGESLAIVHPTALEPHFKSLTCSALVREIDSLHAALMDHRTRDQDCLEDSNVYWFLVSWSLIASWLDEHLIKEEWRFWFHRPDLDTVYKPNPNFDSLHVFPYRPKVRLLEQNDPFLLPVTEPLWSEPVAGAPKDLTQHSVSTGGAPRRIALMTTSTRHPTPPSSNDPPESVLTEGKLLETQQKPSIKCTQCITDEFNDYVSTSLCDYRGRGVACGTCKYKGNTRCSFELSAHQTSDLVNMFFRPWQSLEINHLASLGAQLYQASSQAQYLCAALEDVNTISLHAAQELQQTCASLVESGVNEGVSYMFDPPYLLNTFANLDVAAFQRMEDAILGSRPSSPTSSSSSSFEPSRLTPGHHSIRNASPSIVEPNPSAQDEAVPREEEDDLAMSGVEGAGGDASWEV